MYETLLSKISDTLDGISRVKTHFSVPTDKVSQYPAVFYFPTSVENSFETNEENFKIYRFELIVIVGMQNTTKVNAINGALAKTVDAIIAEFDESWDQGVIGGHRAWIRIYSSDRWQVDTEQQGKEAFAPLTLEVRLLTNN